MQSKDARHLLDEIQMLNYCPNSWEEDFLAGVEDLVDLELTLTPKQAECLQQIYRKASDKQTNA